MTRLLSLYLGLERLMLVAEGVDERAADVLRDAMDPLWYALTDADRDVLDRRNVNFIQTLEGMRVPVGEHFYCTPPSGEKHGIPREPIKGWRKAA